MLYCRVCGKPTDRYLNKETICLLCKYWQTSIRRIKSFEFRVRDTVSSTMIYSRLNDRRDLGFYR